MQILWEFEMEEAKVTTNEYHTSMHYLPLKPRLQRLYTLRNTTEHTR